MYWLLQPAPASVIEPRVRASQLGFVIMGASGPEALKVIKRILPKVSVTGRNVPWPVGHSLMQRAGPGGIVTLSQPPKFINVASPLL